MRESWRKALALLLAVGLVVSLGVVSGCQPSDEEPAEEAPEEAQAVKGGTLRYYIGNPAYLDPYNAQESEGMQVTQSLFDSLTQVDPLDPETINPAAAESWEPNEDATVWTCTLREGVKFHDGSTVDANDVVRSWDAGLNAASPYHIGNTGAFEYPSYLFDSLMNLE